MSDEIEISSVTAFLQHINLNDRTLFRGEPKQYETPCEPSGFRDSAYAKAKWIADPIMQRVDFWRKEVGRVEGRPLISSTDLEHMILAQHYGVATRLLDWTLNPLVALWFSASNLDENDGRIYAHELDEEIYLKSSGTLEDAMSDTMEDPSDRAIALQINPFNADNRRGQYKKWKDVHFFQPAFLPDARILSQSGVISIHPKPNAFDLSLVSKTYKISSQHKKVLCKEIEVLGINARTLGLATRDSLGTSINNKEIKMFDFL